MSTKNISFTIPMDPVVLDSTAGMLLNIADEIRAGNTKKSLLETITEESPTPNNVTELKQPEENKAAKVFGESSAPLLEPEVLFTGKDIGILTADLNIPPPPPPVNDKSINIPQPPDLPPPPFPGSKMVSGRVELDADGRPWDHRIDTEKKTKKKDGRWKLKRGGDKAEAQIIIDQLIASMAVQPIIPEPPQQEEPETFRDQPIEVSPSSEPVMPKNESVNEYSITPSPPPVTTPLTFPQFLTKTTERMQSAFNKAYDTGLKTTLAKKGFVDGNILTLMANEGLIPEIDAEMDIIWNQLNGIPA